MNGHVRAEPELIQPGDGRFPDRFADLAVPPRQLWVQGSAPAPDVRLVAIVGSRAATVSGASRVFSLAADLATEGWAVISGGALGIDAAAHRGALEANGRTYAVLGCGVDVVYPDRHGRLFADIVAGGGGLLSEYGPGTPPRRWQFPARNRVVAALAQVLIVGESRLGSGALITARQAWALGRPVLAVPGSAGTDGLLAAGRATAVSSAGMVRDALIGKPGALAPAIPLPLLRLLRALGEEACSVEDLARRLGAGLGETLALLSEAELGGLVGRSAGAKFKAWIQPTIEASRGH